MATLSGISEENWEKIISIINSEGNNIDSKNEFISKALNLFEYKKQNCKRYNNEAWLRKKYIADDMSQREIASLCGVSRSMIQDKVAEYNIEKKQHKDKKYHNKIWLEKKYNHECMTREEIAEECDVSVGTISHWLSKYNIKKYTRDDYEPMSVESEFPIIADEWSDKNEKQPSEIAPFSNRKVIWNCPNGHEYKKKVNNRTYNDQGCTKCSSSSWERLYADQLAEQGIPFEHHPTPLKTEIGSYEPDFYLPEEDVYIEVKAEHWLREKQQNKIDILRDDGYDIEYRFGVDLRDLGIEVKT